MRLLTIVLAVLATLILVAWVFAGICACYVVLKDGSQRWCDQLEYNAHPPETTWEDLTVTCDDTIYRLGDLRAVVSQR